MERLMIDMGLVILAIGFGYWIGYKSCFEYLEGKLKEYRNELYKRNNMGNDRRMG
jgi:hypothetical protein